jgi:hypothetical protein
MITQDAFTSGKSLMGAILEKMVGINKWQKVFFVEVILLFMTIKGKINFTQMGRYSSSPEVRFRNMFKRVFDFVSFNSMFITKHCSDELLIGFDPSYLSKSAKYTPNVGYFYSGVAGMIKRGMEVGCLAIIDVKQNTAYHFEAVQTPPVKKSESETGLVKHYCKIFSDRIRILMKHSKILVVDGWFNKKNFVDAMAQLGLEVICRLRHDANLKYIYNGPKKKGRGRPKKYSGKVDLRNIDKRVFKKSYQDKEMIIYEAVVYAVSLKKNIKMAYTEYMNEKGQVVNTILYYSTNTSRDAIDIVRYYKARFQMEFIFRDGKQYTGLANCQARSVEKIHNHVNYAMTAVNVAKAIIRKDIKKDQPCSCSIQDIKTELFNQFLLERIFINYDINPELQKNNELKRKILDFGKVAA